MTIDETPASPGEWGFRPADGSESAVNPPGFVWRPQSGAKAYELQVSEKADFSKVVHEAKELGFFCHCPPKPLPAGQYHWRFRFVNGEGQPSLWSKARGFSIGEEATELPMPPREELLDRIPKAHPRLFIRPEDLPRLRNLAKGDLADVYARMIEQCDKLVANPPPTAEPEKYPEGMKRGSDPWRKLWWGNRTYTQKALGGAATLAFARLLGGKDEYGQLARRLLMDCAKWDPKGATGYRYNDEAGMPYNYYFSRAYTFVNDLLAEHERQECRRVMAIRGEEMYKHLCPRHLWRPYSSHSNRAWHFLGEVGIAFLDEIPQAADWVWFATNVFFHAYPVWSDDDGGWHEGSSYWSSYINRFLWWADVMRAAMGIDAYKKPYFSKIGYYPMYLMPPGTKGGGFGDLTASRTSSKNTSLVAICAAQAGNPYWQWYVDAHGGVSRGSSYVDFVRGALPAVVPAPPTDLPTSRCFWGTGQAMLNTNLTDASNNVEVVLKSSPFGTQSHGYESQNSFLLYAFGERVLIRTGRRDSYGSEHHKKWMWHTKSTNCITVNGEGQQGHSAAATGEITAFHTDENFDFVTGEAAKAYGGKLDRFTRSILFVKPELVVVYDQLAAPEPVTFDWRLHAPTEMQLNGQKDIHVENGKAACEVAFLAPAELKLGLTDKFDTPPRPRIKLVEWHLTASTPKPAEQSEFVTLLRPHRSVETVPSEATLTQTEGGYCLRAKLSDGDATILLRSADGPTLRGEGVETDGEVAAVRRDANGGTMATFLLGDANGV